MKESLCSYARNADQSLLIRCRAAPTEFLAVFNYLISAYAATTSYAYQANLDAAPEPMRLVCFSHGDDCTRVTDFSEQLSFQWLREYPLPFWTGC